MRESDEDYFVEADVLTPGPDVAVVGLLLDDAQVVVVESGGGVVEVGQFGEVRHSAVAHLQDRQANRHVVGRPQVLALAVPQVGLGDAEEELRVEGSQVARDEGEAAISVSFLHVCGERPRVPDFSVGAHEVGVDEPGSFPLEGSVEYFEHLPAQQLIVPVDHQDRKSVV